MYALIEAKDGIIGPAGFACCYSFDTYEKAVKHMKKFIEKNGGGEYSEKYGNGFTNASGVIYTYEIFEV